MFKLAILNTHPIQYFGPLYRRLAEEPDIDLTVYFCSDQGVTSYLDRGFSKPVTWDVSLLDGYRHRFLKNWRSGSQVDGFWSLINPGIIYELRKNRYQALIVNGHNHATYLLAILASTVLGIPILMRSETHLLLRRSSLKQALRRPLMHVLYRYMCTLCLPIGTRNKDFYRFLGVPSDKLITVPYAVNNAYFASAWHQSIDRSRLKKDLGLPTNKLIILFASKLTKRKRPMDLLQAFLQVRNAGIEAALLIVGSGEVEQELRDYVHKESLPDVFFVGFRNQSELPGFYSIADVFVLPSENEPWGLVLNEVMCAGLPIIVSKEVGAVPDLIKVGENGFVFDTGDVNELSHHLCVLLREPELRRRMGQASRRIIEGWDYESCVIGIRQALASITSGHQK